MDMRMSQTKDQLGLVAVLCRTGRLAGLTPRQAIHRLKRAAQ